METIDVSYWGLAIGILLLLPPIYYLWRFKTGLVKATCIGALRMCLQLFFIGVYLKYLFLWDSPWINILSVLVMVVVASQTAITRTNLKRSLLFIPISVGFLIAALLVGFYFLGLVLKLHNLFDTQYFIPIFGILMGNMLSVNVVALNAYYTSLSREQQMYYYQLAHGATPFEATSPFLRQAIVKAFSPCIANMAVMGLVSLPGTMIGQILGGNSPDVAIKYQMMIIVITFSASMLSLMITIRLSTRNSFDEYGCLRQVMRSEKQKTSFNE